MKTKHVVVDGSNIATEGRATPSLAQLDSAVRALLDEYPYEHTTVVVDATFGHRIDAKERKAFEEAVLQGEVITPPAGAIGRGDAFVLQIADRAHADVFSNDSFQEFHGQYPWLFDEGRLVGGKPVPNVGWVFVLRALGSFSDVPTGAQMPFYLMRTLPFRLGFTRPREIGRYETELLSFIKSRKADVLAEIKSTGKLEGDIEKRLRDALTEFAKQFSTEDKK